MGAVLDIVSGGFWFAALRVAAVLFTHKLLDHRLPHIIRLFFSRLCLRLLDARSRSGGHIPRLPFARGGGDFPVRCGPVRTFPDKLRTQTDASACENVRLGPHHGRGGEKDETGPNGGLAD